MLKCKVGNLEQGDGSRTSISSLSSTSSESKEDLISYQTISSTNSYIPTENEERLHEWLSAGDIKALYKLFMAQPKKRLHHTQLREKLTDMDIRFNDKEYNRLFLKINQNRDAKCDWNEFVSYLIFGFQDDDPTTQNVALILPISTPPLVKKSYHRSPISCITLVRKIPDDVSYEELLQSNESNIPLEDTAEMNGMYVTASREGQIRFWSPTLSALRSESSESVYLPTQTWILALQAMSDVDVVCTSSTERELRFHETVGTFALRMVIRSLPGAVQTLGYNFHLRGESLSRLILGDHYGNVRILEFSPFLRGPFQSKTGAAMIEIFWGDLLKGLLPSINVRLYEQIHTEWISKLFFSIRLGMLFTSAEYRNIKKYRGRCPGLVTASGDDLNVFRIPLGVKTFFVDEVNHMVVTGSADSSLRIWEVHLSNKPVAILTGHNSGIVMVFIQSDIQRLYSIDYRKMLKVWDTQNYTCLQTFGGLVDIFPGENDLSYYYHSLSRDLIIGGRHIACVKCTPRVRTDLSDGNTHSAPVTVVLYNRLFRNVVTCGLDSVIAVWDPWKGRRKIVMKNCHTKIIYGENINIEITAACFDPFDQFLLTGARDGSLKVWNYNSAVCIRNMCIERDQEVTSVLWVVERILAVGWNQQVTEFNDVEGSRYMDPKKWPMFHTDDITCADIKPGDGVVTATYSGEIIFWKLETGQPYRMYNVSSPHKFIEIKFNQTKQRKKKLLKKTINVSKMVRSSISSSVRNLEHTMRNQFETPNEMGTRDIVSRSFRSSRSSLPVSVQAVLFLQSRPMSKNHGSVLVALDTGFIQVFSHHQRGGYIGEFIAVHKTGDCVLTMCADRKNKFLFTGTAFGYIKIWQIQNYCIPEDERVRISMPKLRLQFIFMRFDQFEPRPKRVVRFQKEPILVNSYQAHLQAVNSLAYVSFSKILISGSHDASVRLWSLGGRYLGTLGTLRTWSEISPYEPYKENTEKYRMPPDIQKVASSTTLKVITGVKEGFSMKKYIQEEIDIEDENFEVESEHVQHDRPLDEPILGHHFSLPGKAPEEQKVELNTSLKYMPVWNHLHIVKHEDIPDAQIPPELLSTTIDERHLFRDNSTSSKWRINPKVQSEDVHLRKLLEKK